MLCDQLDFKSRQRLAELMKEIDESADNKEQFEQDKSMISSNISSNNAYLYSKDDLDSIERINNQLKNVVPMLPPS